MNAEQLRETVFAVLRQIAPETDPSRIKADADLREELDLDSMDFLNFAIALNEATGLDIAERDYPKMATIDGCVRYLLARGEVPVARLPEAPHRGVSRHADGPGNT